MTGPFYFAWVDETETTFVDDHVRVDEEILKAVVSHSEGDFATLTIEIVNPRIGLLAAGRKQWAWFSYGPTDADEVTETEGVVKPLFFGRLVAIPNDLDSETVTLTFLARPLDFAEQKAAVAETMRVRPYWDSIWFSPEAIDDPDNVLESRPMLWHIDRVTHEVTASDINNGEDGTLDLDESQVFYDSVKVSYGQTPAHSVEVTAKVSWNQQATGIFAFGKYMGTVPSFIGFDDGTCLIKSYTGAGIVSNWPQKGTGIGGGWTVVDGRAARIDKGGISYWGYQWTNDPRDWLGNTHIDNSQSFKGDGFLKVVPAWAKPAHVVGFPDFPGKFLFVPLWTIKATLDVEYNVSRKRDELLTFTLKADAQAIVTAPGDAEVIRLSVATSEVTSLIDPDDAMPLGDLRNAVYFGLPRGQQSIEYLIARARAMLLARARAVDIDFEFRGVDAISMELSCRKNAVIVDPRLPGGLAAGKIKEYELRVDGDSGEFIAGVKIGCTIGRGGTVSASIGDPLYVDEGYVDSGYQMYDQVFVLPFGSDVTYEDQTGKPPNDDGVNFYTMRPKDVLISSGPKAGLYQDQESNMDFTIDWSPGMKLEDVVPNTPADVFERLKGVETEIELTLQPLTGGPFLTEYTPTVSDLKMPKTIDLEAESVP
jgi:hypothetical protein